MDSHRPGKTLADYLAIAVSPVLIMCLVGSLSFFLIQVFYRDEAVGSVRWVIFWFVIAVVLVSRIGIEQGAAHAMVYGIALAGATWLYLVRIHPAYLVGVALLAFVWWSAHKLTRDCTLIDEDEDASGDGLLQIAWSKRRRRKEAETHDQRHVVPGRKNQRPAKPKSPAAPHPPGVWLVYFSLAALPLFGIGQTLLPASDEALRRRGFGLLFVYLAATLGLLLATSFLGLRRYLRQRRLPMPGNVAFGWVRFGTAMAAIVLGITLLLPRPGAGYTWHALRYQLDYQLRRASEYALRFNPAAEGRGRSGRDVKATGDQKDNGTTSQPGEGKGKPTGDDRAASGRSTAASQERAQSAGRPAQIPGAPAARLRALLKGLLLLVVGAVLVWWVIRRWSLIVQMIQSFVAAVARFVRNLFAFRLPWKKKSGDGKLAAARRRLFATYANPFLTGADRSWSPEHLILYSYEALHAWAKDHGVEPRPDQTAREFCRELGGQFPEAGLELIQLAYLYGHAAYGTRLPHDCDLDSLRQLWSHFSTPA